METRWWLPTLFFVQVCVLSVGQDLTSFCPLCGQEPTLQDPPVPNEGEVIFRFDMCCPFTESAGDDCVTNARGEAERVTGLNAPLAEGLTEFLEFRLTLGRMLFERSDQPCCDTCSCSGDPNCVAFDGSAETWIVCDAREAGEAQKRLERGLCRQTQAQCAEEKDPYGAACVWVPERDGVLMEDWDVKTMGSPCQPKNESYILMYQADTARVTIGQGERGNIKSVALEFGSNVYNLTADSCVNNGMEDSWSGDGITEYFQRQVEMQRNNNADIVWDVLDPDTLIGVTIRCTAAMDDEGTKKAARLNIESVLEHNPNYAEVRNPLGGYCVTGDLGNTNPSPNTMMITDGGMCFRNGPSDLLKAVRVICDNEAITINGINQCYHRFCLEYFLPYYSTSQECFAAISDPLDPEALQNGFCKAFNSVEQDINECKLTIEEFGWEEATRIYYSRGRPQSGIAECVSDFDDFPDSLPECVEGVELQYFNENRDEWVSVIGIESQNPPCEDAEFTLSFEDHPELFNNRLRFFQKRETQNCLLDRCERQEGFVALLSTELITTAPTSAPTDSPTSPPTSLPTESPSTSPPTSLPTESPSTSPPTSLPTESPSTSPPTSLPTESPSTSPPTSLPTESPSTSPPTSLPTESPSTSPPTSLPTESPSTSPPTSLPTESPSTSPPTSLPTESPSTSPPTSLPTESPSTSPPTSLPTESPSTSPPTSLPTESPSTSPPTSLPTESPSTSPPTSLPTESPSTSPPTSLPTESPSTSPPTSLPTESPSTSPPTSLPTESPSTSPPTSLPTESPSTPPPTSLPTESPSTSPPTSLPTESPATSPPTSLPTESPSTPPPTSLPTESPSASPPTSLPTESPSESPPTSEPTESPSISPPTSLPTESPSISPPTSLPTESPSTPPPSDSPTESPTPFVPLTDEPTLEPTLSPQRVGPPPPPTPVPTVSPTPEPTLSPRGGTPPSPPSLAPTDAPSVLLCPPEDLVPIDIENANLRFNNLAGKGPVPGACEFIWYERVMQINGEDVDLVVREVGPSTYRPSNLNPNANDGVSNNGKFHELGQFQLACDSEVFLEFIFYRSNCDLLDNPCDVATNNACDIIPEAEVGDGILWKAYDLDQHRNQNNAEKAIICNVETIQQVFGSKVDVADSDFCTDGVEFTSTVFGVESDNPKHQDVNDLTPDQIEKLGSVAITPGLTRVRVKYSVLGPDPPNFNPRCGRRILFSGDYCDSNVPTTSTPTPPPVTPSPSVVSTEGPTPGRAPPPPNVTCQVEDIRTIELAKSTLLYNNLGGKGPNIDKDATPMRTLPSDKELIWYQRAVRTARDVDVDVVAREMTERGRKYRPSNLDVTANDGVSNNGKFHELGQINLACASDVLVQYMFIDTECAIAAGPNFDPSFDESCDIVIPELSWTAYDMDQHRNNRNKETVTFCNVFGAVPIFGSLVTQSNDNSVCEGGIKLESNSFGVEGDNPTTQNIDLLNITQIRKLGRVVFNTNNARIIVKYGLSGPDPANFNPRCGRRILFSGEICDLPFTVEGLRTVDP